MWLLREWHILWLKRRDVVWSQKKSTRDNWVLRTVGKARQNPPHLARGLHLRHRMETWVENRNRAILADRLPDCTAENLHYITFNGFSSSTVS
jgi:hypothetical protein